MFGLGTKVYSFLDLTGVIAHPDLGSYPLTGQGVGHILIEMTEPRSFMEVSVQGDVILGRVSGTHQGNVEIACQQVSNMHKFLLYSYQQLVDDEDATKWGRMSAYLKNICDGTEHKILGMMFEKAPPKKYTKEGEMILWRLNAAEIYSTALNPSRAGESILGKLRTNYVPQY
jgi:hypothetical protein